MRRLGLFSLEKWRSDGGTLGRGGAPGREGHFEEWDTWKGRGTGEGHFEEWDTWKGRATWEGWGTGEGRGGALGRVGQRRGEGHLGEWDTLKGRGTWEGWGTGSRGALERGEAERKVTYTTVARDSTQHETKHLTCTITTRCVWFCLELSCMFPYIDLCVCVCVWRTQHRCGFQCN